MRRGGDAIASVERSGAALNTTPLSSPERSSGQSIKLRRGIAERSCARLLRRRKRSVARYCCQNGMEAFSKKGVGRATGKCCFSVRGMARFCYLWNVIYLINNVNRNRAAFAGGPFLWVSFSQGLDLLQTNLELRNFLQESLKNRKWYDS